MSRAEARDFLIEVAVPFAVDEMENATTNYPATTRGIALVNAGAQSNNMPDDFKGRLDAALTQRRNQQIGVPQAARSLLDVAIAWYLKEIESSFLDGDEIVDIAGAFFDLNDSLVDNDEYVVDLGIAIASNPAAGDGLVLRRLTVDHRGQELQGGIKDGDVIFKVTQTSITGAGARTVKGKLYGSAGPKDALDYQGKGSARKSDVDMTLHNEVYRGAISNPTFAVSGAPTNGTAITQAMLSGWTMSDEVGTPTVVWRTTNPWRSKTGGLAVATNGTTKRFEQALVVPQNEDGTANAYTPIDMMTVGYWDGTWSGTITKEWGSESEVFSSASFVGAGFKYLLPTLDELLYPVNFSGVSDPKYALEVATTSASGEFVLQYSDLQRMRHREGYFYSAWSHDDDPEEGASKTWQDSVTYTGREQDAIKWAYDQAGYAYLPTSGANLLATPAKEPEMGVSRGSAIADGGTDNVGSSPSGSRSFDYVVTNTGDAPLAVGPPTFSGGTGTFDTATSDLTAPTVIMPGDSLTIAVDVNDSGAGAYSVVMTIPNNDADEQPYNFTISGTAT